MFEESDDKDIDFKDLKEYIFEEYSNKLYNEKNIDNIIDLLDCFEKKEKVKNIKKRTEKEMNEFLEILIKKNLFTKEEFFHAMKI